MTKKHFNAIAAAFAKNRPAGDAVGRLSLWIELMAAMEDICAESNPNFNRFAFVAACYAGEEK